MPEEAERRENPEALGISQEQLHEEHTRRREVFFTKTSFSLYNPISRFHRAHNLHSQTCCITHKDLLQIAAFLYSTFARNNISDPGLKFCFRETGSKPMPAGPPWEVVIFPKTNHFLQVLPFLGCKSPYPCPSGLIMMGRGSQLCGLSPGLK